MARHFAQIEIGKGGILDGELFLFRRLLHAHIGLCAQFLGVFVRDHRCVARRSRALDFERETLKIDIHLGVVFGDYDGF